MKAPQASLRAPAVPQTYTGRRSLRRMLPCSSALDAEHSLTKGALCERSALAYFDAEIAQPPLAVLSFQRVKPAWQLRSAISSAAFWDGALSFVPQMM